MKNRNSFQLAALIALMASQAAGAQAQTLPPPPPVSGAPVPVSPEPGAPAAGVTEVADAKAAKPQKKPSRVAVAIRIGIVALERLRKSPQQREHITTAAQGPITEGVLPRAHWLLPNGYAYLPPSTNNVFVLWDGKPADVVVKNAAGETLIEIPAQDRYWAVFKRPASIDGLTVDLVGNDPKDISLDGGHNWRLGAALVGPETDSATPAGLTVAERVQRDIGILETGPDAWRMFALSDLYELSLSGNADARLALNAALAAACASNRAGASGETCLYAPNEGKAADQ